MSPEFHIALCLHFHQPHFQLKTVRDQVFANCYYPMMDMLEGVDDPAGELKLNFHVSGPLINYAFRHERSFLDRMKGQVERGVVKIVGGLIDESFPQLSSRIDDTYFQMVRYGIATNQAFGVSPQDWDGFHIVERELGEVLLYQMGMAMEDLGAVPIYYLDVETFYTSYSTAAADENLSLKHFGVVDPAQNSTLPYFPAEAMHAIYRDEIIGKAFFVAPIHSELRYFLLKRKPIFGPDPTCTPGEYLEMIRNKARIAGELIAKKSNREIPPLLFIFNDAELFGQWSNDPVGDRAWMEEFFTLVMDDSEASFTTAREYYERHGYIDTYPIKSSTSYQEFENWTMKRGIRGVTFADPKLRRVISCLRDLEKSQERVERVVLERVNKEVAGTIPSIIMDEITPRVLASRKRYDLIRTFMAQFYPEKILKAYDLIHTIRNLTYQEDPRWASRHPNFGSCTYYDLTGLAYIAVADRLSDYLFAELSETWGSFPKTAMEIADWDYDGNDEVILNNDQQSLVISKMAGTVIHHQMHSPYFKGMDFDKILAVAETLVTEMPMFPATGFYSQCLLHTEPDSELCVTLEEDSRVEYCRDAYRANFTARGEDGALSVIGSFDYVIFDLDDYRVTDDTMQVTMSAGQQLTMPDGRVLEVTLVKTFSVTEDSFSITFDITKETDPDDPAWEGIRFVPELVNSVTPADDIDGRLDSFVRLNANGRDQKIALTYHVTTFPPNGGSFYQEEYTETIFAPRSFQYVLGVKTPFYGSFYDVHTYRMAEDTSRLVDDIEITPAVHHFYTGYVFDDHSRLGYHQSGAKISPFLKLEPGETTRFEVTLTREIVEIQPDDDLKAGSFPLIRYGEESV